LRSIAARLSILPSNFFASLILRLEELRAEGRDIIRLDEGSPDLPPAPHIIEALKRSVSSPDVHGYQPHRGLKALRSAWTEMYLREYGVELDPESEVIPLLGSKEGIINLSLSYVNPGDIVLVPNPGYVSYERGALLAGGEVYSMLLYGENNYLPDLSAIPPEILKKTKLMWLNYPNNPTASVANRSFFSQAVDLAQEHDFLLCHDAAYTQVTFEEIRPLSLLEIPNARKVAVEFNTLSKSHNMAGWRSGVLVGNSDALQEFYKLKTNVDSGHFLPILEASIVALTSDQNWLLERNEIYRQRRDIVITALLESGLSTRIPQASIYVWSPVLEGWNSLDFASSALENAGVSLTPGTVFGSGGEGYVRISLTAPLERIQLAMERLKEWMNHK